MFGTKYDNGGRAQGFGLGLLIGALVGAGAALLLAPASGDDTRKRLRREARRAYLRGSDVLEDAMDNGERAARRMAQRGVERGREVLGKL
ncbi:MAG: YtxH domain-containing protein [Gemmatimonadaceae bacterium]|nr:YtxH domain-containing protein [Gemmatimonadaceae bacterium]